MQPSGDAVPQLACGYGDAVDVTLGVMGGKWKLPIYRELRRGTRRFGQLRRALPGVTQTMLTQQLRALEEDGVVARAAYPEVPPRVEYALTDFGRTLDGVLAAMGAWGKQYQAQAAAAGRALRPRDEATAR